MSLPAGTRFGPYEIHTLIGAGGMGEVYRGVDTTLHRGAAVKVLPDSFARDPDRIARLQREARTLASLNDPNIAAIYGFVEAGGRQALVMELVEGPTLADRIAGGPLPVAESLAVARQVAKALEAAHLLGIIHRDLKPANIKVRDEGTVKVLDFGLAKAIEGGSADPAMSPTITSPALLTAAGLIIGSAAYMAPEQAKGLAADKRSDIWAFGCVFYEMLTGRRAFEGPGVTETLAAVLRGEPDWTALPPDLPAPARTLLMRCLEKDRASRVQDISTAGFVLAEQAGLSGSPLQASALPPRRTRAAWWIGAAAVAGVLAGAGAVAWLQRSRGSEPRPTRFDLALHGETLVPSHFGAAVALSPDGSTIVYTATHDGVPQLMVRRLDRVETAPIPDSEGAVDPFFSPDGREIGFIVTGEMRRVPIDGGRSAVIWRGDPTFEGAAWRSDGVIIFSQDSALYRVSVNGGERVKIAGPDTSHDETGYDRPVLLPGGDAMVYTVELRGARSRIAARRLSGGEATTLIEDAFGGQYLPPGYLVFGRTDRLYAVPFDAAALRVTGAPVPLEQGVFANTSEGVSNVSIAANGTAVFVSGLNSGIFGRLTWLDRAGTRVGRLVDEPLEHPRNVRLSPDGHRLALTVGPPGQGNIWNYDVSGATPPLKLTFRDHNIFGVWSSDGRRIAFMTLSGDTFKDAVLPADGSAVQPQTLQTSGIAGAPMDWSGTTLIFYRDSTLWLLHPPDTHETPWMKAPFSMFNARVSPDGHWAAYSSTQSGMPDVWVRPFPGDGAPVRVSSSGGHEPVWSRDGKELFFTWGTRMMAAKVIALDHEARFDAPQQLFQGGFAYDMGDLILRFYDVAPDGRFLVVEPVETKNVWLVVAQHWDEEVRKLLAK